MFGLEFLAPFRGEAQALPWASGQRAGERIGSGHADRPVANVVEREREFERRAVRHLGDRQRRRPALVEQAAGLGQPALAQQAGHRLAGFGKDLLHIALGNPHRLGDIGAAIQAHAEKQRYGVVRDFCGHGLGRLFHDAPEVVHAARAGTGPELKPGMFFTIEPMINLGKPAVKILDDGWTAVTRDRSLSAQFEHSIGITEDGCEIFTTSPKGLHKPPYAA